MYCYSYDFVKPVVAKVAITDSIEGAKELEESGRGFKLLFPNPDSEEEKKCGVYLLISEEEFVLSK